MLQRESIRPEYIHNSWKSQRDWTDRFRLSIACYALLYRSVNLAELEQQLLCFSFGTRDWRERREAVL